MHHPLTFRGLFIFEIIGNVRMESQSLFSQGVAHSLWKFFRIFLRLMLYYAGAELL